MILPNTIRHEGPLWGSLHRAIVSDDPVGAVQRIMDVYDEMMKGEEEEDDHGSGL